MINYKKDLTNNNEFLTIIPIFVVVGYFGDEQKSDVLIESELYDDTLDYFNSIYTNSCTNAISKKNYSFNDLKKAELRVNLVGIVDDLNKQVPLFSTVIKTLNAVYETPTTKIKIKDRTKKKSPVIELTITECLDKYINTTDKEYWEKYDISDWRYGLETSTNYIEV